MGKRGNKTKRGPKAPPAAPTATRGLVERFEARLGTLRSALLELLESQAPGSTRTLRERPAIEAEIWAVEAQLAVERNELDRARQCNAEAQRCQAEARKASALDAEARVRAIEVRLGLVGELEAELEHLR